MDSTYFTHSHFSIMKKFLLFFLLFYQTSAHTECSPSVFILGEGIVLLEQAPPRYTIMGSETWRDVLARFIVDPDSSAESWQKNSPILKRGDVVQVIETDKKPALQIKRGRDVKLCPTVRIFKEKRESPVIPTESVQQFLNRPKIVTEEEIEYAPKIVANEKQSLLSTEGDIIYVEGIDESTEEYHYVIFRLGESYHSQDSDEILAREAVYLGDAELKRFGESEENSDLAVLKITTARREITTGNYLLPLGERKFNDDFHPHAPDSNNLEDAEIIAVVEGVSQIGQYQVVVINKGSDEDMEVGHVLLVHKREIRVKDKEITLPRQQVGTIMVFKTFDKISYALVMKATSAIHIYDMVTAP
jgi:hypothetical protein